MLRRSGATHEGEILYGNEGLPPGVEKDSLLVKMIRIAISSEPRLLNILRAVVKFCAQEAGLSKSDVEYAALAIDEAAANVIRHTYGGRHDALLALAVRSLPDRLEFLLGLRSQGPRASDPTPASG